MAVCTYCDQEMRDNVSCTAETYSDFPDGVERTRIRYGAEEPPWEGDPCHDCSSPKGGLHHPGCDVERCPGCGGQAISCGCTSRGEGTSMS